MGDLSVECRAAMLVFLKALSNLRANGSGRKRKDQ